MRADREGPQAPGPVSITDLERLVHERTEALERERDRAEAASQAKSRFLANMSHELRTPLNAVIGAAQLLETLAQSPPDDPAQQTQLTRLIRTSGENLLGIINDILDLSRIEAGALRLTQEAYDVVECIESTVETVAIRAREKGLELACIIDADLPQTLLGDPVHVRQVLVNVLGNAVKFTASGEVVLTATMHGVGAVRQLRIAVRDTGVGIVPTARQRIFEAFGQADDTAARHHGGTGLGLTISREMVRAMGGQIDFDSTPGQGSCFHIHLPLVAAPLPHHGDQPSVSIQAAMFEPHGPSRQGLAAQLHRLGLSVRALQDPAQTEQWCRSLPADSRPFVLVRLDAGTHAAQGQQLVRLVREHRPDAQILGLLGSADTRAHQAMGYGVSQVMLKPLATALLRDLLTALPGSDAAVGAAGKGAPGRFERLPMAPEVPRELLARLSAQIRASAAQRRPSDPDAPDGPSLKARVLLVDDDAVNRLIAEHMLQELGCTVQSAASGEQALQALARSPHDVVIMDCQMPGMDGLEVTRRIRRGEAGPAAQRLPVIALTASAFQDDRSACFAAGMDDFLGKPLLRDALHVTLRRWVSAH